MKTQTTSDDLVERLWASDAASALTNQAAREIERLRADIDRLNQIIDDHADAIGRSAPT